MKLRRLPDVTGGEQFSTASPALQAAAFDKPDRLTVSGVHRGLQRALYDARRDELIPAHGIRLIVVTPADLDATPQGRLRRNPDHDLKALAHILQS